MWAKNFTTNTKHTWIIKMQSRWQKELSFLIEKINKEVLTDVLKQISGKI